MEQQILLLSATCFNDQPNLYIISPFTQSKVVVKTSAELNC